MLGDHYIIARAGGGEHSSSSSSSHSSSSSGSSYSSSSPSYSSSSSSGSGSYPSSSSGRNGFDIGGIFIFIFMVGLFAFMIYRALKMKTVQPGAISPTTDQDESQIHSRAARASVAEIKKVDPGFSEQAFKDYAQNAFFKVQEAWESQDLEIARPYVSDSVMQRYATQLSDMKSRGERNVLENIVISAMDIKKVSLDTNFHYITVRIQASAVDYTVNAENKMVSGSEMQQFFVELWTFMRSADAKTPVGDAAVAAGGKKCPSCGAPLQQNATGKCEYCGTVTASGSYNWILSEITQAQ